MFDEEAASKVNESSMLEANIPQQPVNEAQEESQLGTVKPKERVIPYSDLPDSFVTGKYTATINFTQY